MPHKLEISATDKHLYGTKLKFNVSVVVKRPNNVKGRNEQKYVSKLFNLRMYKNDTFAQCCVPYKAFFVIMSFATERVFSTSMTEYK